MYCGIVARPDRGMSKFSQLAGFLVSVCVVCMLEYNAKNKHILEGSEKWKTHLQLDNTEIDLFFSHVKYTS